MQEQHTIADSQEAVFCRISLPEFGGSPTIPACAVRLDRLGGIFRLPSAAMPRTLSEGSQIVVIIDLPHRSDTNARRLCFRGSVRHVSAGPGMRHWMGVSFHEAAIYEVGQC